MAIDSTDSWRTYLQQIVNSPDKKRDLADQLNVEVKTLERWMSGESRRPRPALIKHLISLLPSGQQETFTTFLLADPDIAREDYGLLLQQPGSFGNSLQEDIPSVLYERVLEAAAQIGVKEERFNTIVDLILHQGAALLDPNRVGLMLFIAQCMPPLNSKVQSVVIRTGRKSTDPFDLASGRYYFFGRESLSGYCISTCRTQVIQDSADPSYQIPVQLGGNFAHQASMAALPIHRGTSVAGCLLASSSQKQHFTTARLDLLRKMANLMMLAFSDSEFHPQEDIALRLLPSIEAQEPYFHNFVSNALSLVSQARLEGTSLHYQEAQQHLLCDIEQRLIKGTDHAK